MSLRWVNQGKPETTAPALGAGDADPRSPERVDRRGENTERPVLGAGDEDPRSPAVGEMEIVPVVPEQPPVVTTAHVARGPGDADPLSPVRVVQDEPVIPPAEVTLSGEEHGEARPH